MRKIKLLIATALLTASLTGCSSEGEVIRIGEPYLKDETSGVKFHTDVTDPDAIAALRDLVSTEKETEKPEDLLAQADTSFILDIPEEGVLEIWRYVWYQEDGSAILSNEDLVANVKDYQKFYMLAAEQTEELKGIIEE